MDDFEKLNCEELRRSVEAQKFKILKVDES